MTMPDVSLSASYPTPIIQAELAHSKLLARSIAVPKEKDAQLKSIEI